MALIIGEPGSEVVERAAAEDDTTISAINYSEALQKATRHGVAPEDVGAAPDALGVTVSPFGRLDARLAASFYRHRSGLSLADRVCLALARNLASPAYSSDRLWQSGGDVLGVRVTGIRAPQAHPGSIRRSVRESSEHRSGSPVLLCPPGPDGAV